MPDFGIFRGFNSKLFSDKLYAGQLPTQLGKIGSESFGLLLDLYPSAAVAYSLRKLRSAYTGSAIRVRRSSDNTEQDIGFTLTGDLDTSSLTSFCGSGNGFVTTWYDQSGNARNATQTTAANQPQIVSNGSVINVNSKPSLLFENDIMKFIGSGTSSSNTLFMLYKCNNLSSTFQNICSIGDVRPSTAFCYMYTNPSGALANSRTIYSDFIQSTDGARTTNQELVAINAVSSNISMFVNNSSETITNSSRTLTSNLNDLQIGSDTQYNDYLNGNIQEIVLYTTAQTTNVGGINSNINSYYGIY